MDLEFILSFQLYYPLLILYFLLLFVVNTFFLIPLVFQTHEIKPIGINFLYDLL